ncbi:3-oxoacyl-[acyl-carrier protein] reductase [Clostridium sp. CAG:729]|nr:3-oxoacyl-[acyl-carrier protein] reductase [Clostridium sp. CAG:729]
MLKTKIAIVTGATSGIGEATAKELAQNGTKVVLVGRNFEKGEKIAKEIDGFFIKCDVSNENDVKNMINETIGKLGKIDILFNNAGVMLPSMEIERMPVEDWEKSININLTGCFLVSKYAKPYIVKEKGTIINNASIAGLQHYAAGRSYAYSASKAAVIQFSHQMAKNYGEEGVRVNCICPGIIETPILGDRDPKIYAQRVPLGRVGTPEDVAKVVKFLVSDDAKYLTGCVIPIDGGVSL